ncbi:DUF92 domain-containing protein [Rubrivirga sp. IMCC43871]|uniref:DUF92 domain-containing protein n=1 Tax=Rubrivirga sp. IMCC43871 TaxID=3391575 RepID=UPI00398F9AB9
MTLQIDLDDLALFALLLGAAVAAGEGLRRLGGRPESTRRVVHALVGLATAAAPEWFDVPDGIYLLASVFFLGNAVALARGWLPSMHAVERRSWGTVLFPLALIAALGLTWSPLADRVWALQAAFAVLALADPAASMVGLRWERGRAGRKTAAGSLAFAVIAIVVTATVLTVAGPDRGVSWVVAASLSAAALATIAEALGRNGWDNVWIVLAVVVVLTVADGADSGVLGLATGLAAVFGWGTWRVGALDASGALAGSLLAWGLVAIGGWAWAVPALAFFVLSSTLSRLGHQRKASAEALAAKGSRRDARQVLANGGVALAALAASAFVAGPGLYVAFVGSFAAAAADTWATEIGTLIGGSTRRLGLGPRVPPGTSGGVSWGGTLGAVLGATSVTLPAAWLIGASGGWMLALVGAGVSGAVLDSVLGATLQARYRAADGRLTERSVADGVALPLAGGQSWLGNDGVNAACTVAGGLLAAMLVA